MAQLNCPSCNHHGMVWVPPSPSPTWVEYPGPGLLPRSASQMSLHSNPGGYPMQGPLPTDPWAMGTWHGPSPSNQPHNFYPGYPVPVMTNQHPSTMSQMTSFQTPNPASNQNEVSIIIIIKNYKYKLIHFFK